MKSPFCIKICTVCNSLLVANDINFRKKKKGKYGLYSICRECDKKQKREYCKRNNEEHRKRNRKWRKENKNYHTIYSKKWRENNPEKELNRLVRRRQREENQGNGITKEQWYEMMGFFEWKCAYSGKNLDDKTRTIDHIVPLNKNGKHEIWNLVPMHKNYNSSKHINDMLEWYQQQEFYSEERLNKIYEWIEYSFKKYFRK